MTLLNRPSNGHVASMVAVWRTLRTFGPMSSERLAALCRFDASPPTPVGSATVATWANLGLFQQGDRVEIAPRFVSIGVDDVESLRTAVFSVLMESANCPHLLDPRPIGDRASDFVRVAAWCLAQDPYVMAGWGEVEVLQAAAGQGMAPTAQAGEPQPPDLWEGTGRWNSFLDWADFCGLGLRTPQGFVVNPARAIRVVLGTPPLVQGLRTDSDMLLKDFVVLLSQQIPLLEEGRYRLPVDERIGRANVFTQDHRLSACTSLALLQLEHEGEIFLNDRAGDVADRYGLVGRGGNVFKLISHVRRGTPRHTVRPMGGQS